MNDFTRIRNELVSLGWTPEKAKGDHFKFRKESVEQYIVVAMSVSSANSAYLNCLEYIRRIEPRFSLGRPSNWVPKVDEQPEQAPEPEAPRQEPPASVERDRQVKKKYKWLKIGEDVILRATGERYVISAIGSADSMHVLDETDIITLVPHAGTGLEHVFPEDLDSLKEMKCIVCGRYRPINHFNLSYRTEEKKCTCLSCLQEAEEKDIPLKENDMQTQDSAGSTPVPTFSGIILDKETLLEHLAGEITNKAAEKLVTTKKKELASMSKRQGDRLVEKRAESLVNKIKDSIRKLDFSSVPNQLILSRALDIFQEESMTEIEAALATCSDEMLEKEIARRGLKPAVAEEQEEKHEQTASISALEDEALYEELKRRGYEGEMTKIIKKVLS